MISPFEAYEPAGSLICKVCGWVHYPEGKGPKHAYECPVGMNSIKTIFDEGAIEVLGKALEALVGTEQLLVVNNPAGGPLIDRENVRTYALAMIDEVTEWAKELHWKPWKVPQPVNAERLVDEFADILAFLGVLVQLTKEFGHVTGEDLARAFEAKSLVNIQRINVGSVPGYIGEAKVKSELEVGAPYVLRLGDHEHDLAVYTGLTPEGYHEFKVRTPAGDLAQVTIEPRRYPHWAALPYVAEGVPAK